MLTLNKIIEFQNLSRFFVNIWYLTSLQEPARADISKTNSSSGFSSCLKCYKKGESVATENRGTVRTFEFNKQESLVNRDHNKYLKDVNSSIKKNKMVNGIKGRSLLADLKYYKPLDNTNIDCMHSLFYGIIKHLFKYWFELPNNKYSFKNYIA